MRPHPRIHKTVKWGGLVIAGLLGVLWWISSTWGMGFDGRRGPVVIVAAGRMNVAWRDEPAPPVTLSGWFFDKLRVPDRSTWSQSSAWYRAALRFPRERSASMTCWLAICLALSATTTAHWLDVRGRKRPGFCPACSYDRTGLAPTAACPECGKAAT